MPRRSALLVLVCALAAGPAQAATALETARAQAEAARAKVNSVRKDQMTLRAELNQVARRIEGLKAGQDGPLLPGSELDAALRRSQELSATLTQLAQALSTAETSLEQENLALLKVLSRELDLLRQSWDVHEDRAARQAVVEKMRALRLERDQVRAMLPAAKVPQLTSTGSDDPEDLLEQADLLRDNEDKVRQRMRQLQARITELREERELDRRMSDFLGEEAMFDEQDRRLRRQRTTEMAQERQPPLLGLGAPAADEAAAPGVGASAGGGEFSGSPPPPSDPTRGNGDTVQPLPPVITTQIARGVDARPQVSGGVESLLVESVDEGNLDALEAQVKKLEELARTLEARADDLEARAGQLD